MYSYQIKSLNFVEKMTINQVIYEWMSNLMINCCELKEEFYVSLSVVSYLFGCKTRFSPL